MRLIGEIGPNFYKLGQLWSLLWNLFVKSWTKRLLVPSAKPPRAASGSAAGYRSVATQHSQQSSRHQGSFRQLHSRSSHQVHMVPQSR